MPRLETFFTPQKAKNAFDIIKNTKDKDWYTIRDIAELLDQSPCWVWLKVTKSGLIKKKRDLTKGVKNKYYIISSESLSEFLKTYMNFYKKQ